MVTTEERLCETDLIASYVDGELEDKTRARLEQHLESCGQCRIELRAHQLFMCELDSALTQPMDVAMPPDFSRVVAARASSDMSGVRSASEHRKALAFCVILAFVAFVLLGATTSEAAFNVARRLAATFWAVIGFFWTTFYDAVASLTVISRVLSRKFIVESGSAGLLVFLLGLAIFVLTRLIFNYHRTGATE